MAASSSCLTLFPCPFPYTYTGASTTKASSSVAALDVPGVIAFVAARPQLAAHVGPAGSEGEWSVKEVGDGNLNFVFIVQVRRMEGGGWALVHQQGGSHTCLCAGTWSRLLKGLLAGVAARFLFNNS